MEGAGSKERFGNTPENKIRPDWSKLNPGCSRFQAMALSRHLTADAVISEAVAASKFGLFRAEVCYCRAISRLRRLFQSNGCNQAGQTTRPSLGRPALRAADCAAIRKSRDTADGACSNLSYPGFFVAPDGSLQPYNPNWRILFVSVPNQHRRLSLFAQLFLQKKRVFPLPAQIFTLPA